MLVVLGFFCFSVSSYCEFKPSGLILPLTLHKELLGFPKHSIEMHVSIPKYIGKSDKSVKMQECLFRANVFSVFDGRVWISHRNLDDYRVAVCFQKWRERNNTLSLFHGRKIEFWRDGHCPIESNVSSSRHTHVCNTNAKTKTKCRILSILPQAGMSKLVRYELHRNVGLLLILHHIDLGLNLFRLPIQSVGLPLQSRQGIVFSNRGSSRSFSKVFSLLPHG